MGRTRTGPFFVLSGSKIETCVRRPEIANKLPVMSPDLPAVEIAIIDKTNVFRRQNKLHELRRNPRLDQAARRFAAYLARSGKFSHTADGRQPAERIKAAGYRYCQVAENLALNVDSRGFRAPQLAETVVTGWKNSPGHRRNMLVKSMTEIGVAVIRATPEHRYLSVQLFGRPDSLKFKFQVRNNSRVKVTYRYAGRRVAIPARSIITHTACTPGTIRFDNVYGSSRPYPSTVRLPARANEQFVIQKFRQGVRVSQRPHTN